MRDKQAIGRKAVRDVMAIQKVLGWTDKELAHEANLSVGTVRNWCTNGVSNPYHSTVILLLEAMEHGMVIQSKARRNY